MDNVLTQMKSLVFVISTCLHIIGILIGLTGIGKSDKIGKQTNMDKRLPLPDIFHSNIPKIASKRYADIPVILSLVTGFIFVLTLDGEYFYKAYLESTIAFCILNIMRPVCYCSTILPAPCWENSWLRDKNWDDNSLSKSG